MFGFVEHFKELQINNESPKTYDRETGSSQNTHSERKKERNSPVVITSSSLLSLSIKKKTYFCHCVVVMTAVFEDSSAL